jgi:hypothetical protein
VTAGVVIPDDPTSSCRVVLDGDGQSVGAVCPGRRADTWTVTVHRRVLTVDTEAEADRVAGVLMEHRFAGCWMGLQPNETCRCDPAVSS